MHVFWYVKLLSKKILKLSQCKKNKKQKQIILSGDWWKFLKGQCIEIVTNQYRFLLNFLKHKFMILKHFDAYLTSRCYIIYWFTCGCLCILDWLGIVTAHMNVSLTFIVDCLLLLLQSGFNINFFSLMNCS